MINRRIAFRFNKDFTEEQYIEMKSLFKLTEDSDVIRKLLYAGYSQYHYAGENIEKVKKMMDALGVSSKDLTIITKQT